MNKFTDLEISNIIEETLKHGNKVILGTDWHLIRFDKTTRQFYKRPNWKDIICMQNEACGKDDVFIFLGDLVDDEVTDIMSVYDLFSYLTGRPLTGKYKFMIRGNNDTFSDEHYKLIGFDEVVYGIRYNSLFFSHVSVPFNFNRDFGCYTNIHGHMHRDGTPVDSIAYYHDNPYNNICVCTDDCHPIDLKHILDNIDEEKARNCNSVKGIEKPGMSRFLLNKSIEKMIELFDIE